MNHSHLFLDTHRSYWAGVRTLLLAGLFFFIYTVPAHAQLTFTDTANTIQAEQVINLNTDDAMFFEVQLTNNTAFDYTNVRIHLTIDYISDGGYSMHPDENFISINTLSYPVNIVGGTSATPNQPETVIPSFLRGQTVTLQVPHSLIKERNRQVFGIGDEETLIGVFRGTHAYRFIVTNDAGTSWRRFHVGRFDPPEWWLFSETAPEVSATLQEDLVNNEILYGQTITYQVPVGQQVRLAWVTTPSSPYTQCRALTSNFTVDPADGYGSTYTVGEFLAAPPPGGSETYRVECEWDQTGESAIATVTLISNESVPSVTATLSHRASGESTWRNNSTYTYPADAEIELRWESTNATACSRASGPTDFNVSGTSGTDSSVTEPTAGGAATTYGVTCTDGSGGSAVASVQLSRLAAPVVSDPVSCGTFSASPSTVAAGASATLSWTNTNAQSLALSNPYSTTVYFTGPVTNAGSYVVTPSQTTTYTATVTGGDGSTCTNTTTVTVDAVLPPPPSPTNPAVEVEWSHSQTATWYSTDGSYPADATLQLRYRSEDVFTCAANPGSGFSDINDTDWAWHEDNSVAEPVAGASQTYTMSCSRADNFQAISDSVTVTKETVAVPPVASGDLYCDTLPTVTLDTATNQFEITGRIKSSSDFSFDSNTSGSGVNVKNRFRIDVNNDGFTEGVGGDVYYYINAQDYDGVPGPAGRDLTYKTSALPAGTHRIQFSVDYPDEYGNEPSGNNTCPALVTTVPDLGEPDLVGYDRYVIGTDASDNIKIVSFEVDGVSYDYTSTDWFLYAETQFDVTTVLDRPNRLAFYPRSENHGVNLDSTEGYRVRVEVDFNYNGTFVPDESIVSVNDIHYANNTTNPLFRWYDTGYDGANYQREIGFTGPFPLGNHRWRFTTDYLNNVNEGLETNNMSEGSFVIIDASRPACDDGGDNDNDGTTDYPDDPGCDDATDDDESDGPSGGPSPSGPLTGSLTIDTSDGAQTTDFVAGDAPLAVTISNAQTVDAVTWACTNGTAASATGFSASGESGSDTTPVQPPADSSYDYQLVCEQGAEQQTYAVRVSKYDDPPGATLTVCVTESDSFNNGTCVDQNSATPLYIAAGDTINLDWSSANAVSCAGSGKDFNTGGAPSGDLDISTLTALDDPETYTVSCTNAAGVDADASVTIRIGTACLPGEGITAPDLVRANEAFDLTWQKPLDIMSCTLTGSTLNETAPTTLTTNGADNGCLIQDESPLTLENRTVFTMSCDGNYTETAIVNVIPQLEEF